MGANESRHSADPNQINAVEQQVAQQPPPSQVTWEPRLWSTLQGWPDPNAIPDDPLAETEAWKTLHCVRVCPGGVSFDVLDPKSVEHLRKAIVDMNNAYLQEGHGNLLDSTGLPLDHLPHWDQVSQAITSAVQSLLYTMGTTANINCVRAVAKRSQAKQVDRDWITAVKVSIADVVMNRPQKTDPTWRSPNRPQSLEQVQSEPGYIVATDNADFTLTVDLSQAFKGGEYLLASKGVYPAVHERLYRAAKLPPFDTTLRWHHSPEGPIPIVPWELIPFIPAAPWYGKVCESTDAVAIEFSELTGAVNRQAFWMIPQRTGRGILHAGAQRYKNLPPQQGTRLSLILSFDRVVNLSQLNTLSGPLVERILCFLNPRDLAAVRRSSKALRAMTFAPSIWRTQVQAEVVRFGGDYRSVYVHDHLVPIEWDTEDRKAASPEGEQKGLLGHTPSPLERAFADRMAARGPGALSAGYAGQSNPYQATPSSPVGATSAHPAQLPV